MTRERYVPKVGRVYRNQGGGEYRCTGTMPDGSARFMNMASGWILNAHGIGMYEDGSIDWDYSTDGHFVEVT